MSSLSWAFEKWVSVLRTQVQMMHLNGMAAVPSSLGAAARKGCVWGLRCSVMAGAWLWHPPWAPSVVPAQPSPSPALAGTQGPWTHRVVPAQPGSPEAGLQSFRQAMPHFPPCYGQSLGNSLGSLQFQPQFSYSIKSYRQEQTQHCHMSKLSPKY